MTAVQKELIEQALNTFENEDIRNFARIVVSELPNYFFEVGASSSGKYHPQYSFGDGGLLRHSIAVVRFINYFLELEQYNSKLTTRECDLMRLAALVHDGMKSGTQEEFEESKYTKFDHPILMANRIREYKGHCLNEEEVEMVATTIETHMGQWNVDKKTEIELPKPVNKYQRLVHLADYLSSRKDLAVDFTNYKTESPKKLDVDEYVFTFGKHKGQKIVDVYKEHPDYIDWMQENLSKKDILQMIKILKERDKK